MGVSAALGEPAIVPQVVEPRPMGRRRDRRPVPRPDVTVISTPAMAISAVEDFLMSTLGHPHLVVDTKLVTASMFGRSVRRRVSWSEPLILRVDRKSARLHPAQLVNRAFEQRLFGIMAVRAIGGGSP
jgi:hypothetical protein